MKCSITSINVKILSRALHSLAKIGDELHIDPQKEGLSFRAVNTIKSAYAEFIFFPSFFTSYRYSAGGTDNGEGSQCKIAMRSCLAVFRAGAEKNTESCALRLAPTGQHLVIELSCRSGSLETHHLPVVDTDGLVAVFTRDDSPNQLAAEARVWVEAVHNFQATQDEVTLTVGQDRVTLSSYIDQIPDPHKVVRTELCLRAGEFDTFDVTEEAAITFKLKDLRSMLAFGDGVSLPIAMHFDSRGKPVVFDVKSHTFDATFVLATLSPPADTQTTCSQGSALVVTNPITTKRPGSEPSDNSIRQSKRRTADDDLRANEARSESSNHSFDVALQENANEQGTESTNSPTNHRKRNSIDVTARRPSCILSDELNHQPSNSPRNNVSLKESRSRQPTDNSEHLESIRERNDENASLTLLRNRRTSHLDPSPFTFVDRAPSSKSSDRMETDDALSDLNFDPYELSSDPVADMVPGTPPQAMSEQARFIFQRCFEPTFDYRQLSQYNHVLADDSAEEDN